MVARFAPPIVTLIAALMGELFVAVHSTTMSLFTQDFPAIPVGGSIGGSVVPVSLILLILPYILLATIFVTVAVAYFMNIRMRRIRTEVQ